MLSPHRFSSFFGFHRNVTCSSSGTKSTIGGSAFLEAQERRLNGQVRGREAFPGREGFGRACRRVQAGPEIGGLSRADGEVSAGHCGPRVKGSQSDDHQNDEGNEAGARGPGRRGGGLGRVETAEMDQGKVADDAPGCGRFRCGQKSCGRRRAGADLRGRGELAEASIPGDGTAAREANAWAEAGQSGPPRA